MKNKHELNYKDLRITCDTNVFDFETTGVAAENDRIIEIGAVKCKNGKIIDGSGKSAFFADVAIKDGKIVKIGKIAGEQLIKLMTLGLSEQEAEEQIVNGFLK